MEATLNIYEPVKKSSDFKKAITGLVFTFAIELVFFAIAVIGVSVLWYLVFYCTGSRDHQNTYIYNPYELKYFIITVGGIKKRVAVKRFLHRRKIIVCQ